MPESLHTQKKRGSLQARARILFWESVTCFSLVLERVAFVRVGKPTLAARSEKASPAWHLVHAPSPVHLKVMLCHGAIGSRLFWGGRREVQPWKSFLIPCMCVSVKWKCLPKNDRNAGLRSALKVVTSFW